MPLQMFSINKMRSKVPPLFFFFFLRFSFFFLRAGLRQQTLQRTLKGGMCSVQSCSMRDGSKGCLKEVIKRSVTFPNESPPHTHTHPPSPRPLHPHHLICEPQPWRVLFEGERVGGLPLGSCTFLFTNSPNLHRFNGCCVH